jgi:hypothetical protein
MVISQLLVIDNTREYPVVCHVQGARRIVVHQNTNSTTPPAPVLNEVWTGVGFGTGVRQCLLPTLAESGERPGHAL